jgi:hypothetical protein
VDLSTIANVATALTVLTGVGFGLMEARRARQERRERAAFAAVQVIMTPSWMNSMVLVQSIPDGASAADIQNDPRRFEAAQRIGLILEGIGYSVFARIVPLSVVDDLLGGTIRVAFRKMRPYIEFERNRAGSRKTWEWFEWLAIQLDRHSPGKTSLQLGAHEVYRDWEP